MARIILVSGLQRSGTTLMHRLLDGHSALWVMPGESALHPNKFVFPDLSAAVANRRFNLCYEFDGAMPAWDLFRSATLRKIQKNFEIDNPDFVFDFEGFMAKWKSAVEDQAEWTERGIIEGYLAAMFDNLESHPHRNSEIYVLKTPRLGLDHRRFFELFPDGRLILMNRRMESYVASEVGRSGVHPRTPVDRARRLRLLARFCRLHKFSDQAIAELAGDSRVKVVDFNTLTDDPETEMKSLADFLEIGFEPALTVPSVYGEPWISNSSFLDERAGTRGQVVQVDDRKRSLTATESVALSIFDHTLSAAPPSSVFATS